jgi:predicted ABC-type sugar transport system permease subunit
MQAVSRTDHSVMLETLGGTLCDAQLQLHSENRGSGAFCTRIIATLAVVILGGLDLLGSSAGADLPADFRLHCF